MQSFSVALNSLSNEYRISALPSQAERNRARDQRGPHKRGYMGVMIRHPSGGHRHRKHRVHSGIARTRQAVLVEPHECDGVREHLAAGVEHRRPAKKIAQGVQDNGFGDMGGMMLGVGFAQGVNPMTGAMPGQQMNPANAMAAAADAQPVVAWAASQPAPAPRDVRSGTDGDAEEPQGAA